LLTCARCVWHPILGLDSWSWRDFCFSRARRLILNLLGQMWGRAEDLKKCRGKTVRGVQVQVMLRLLAALDAREAIIAKYGAYPIERKLGTDSVENLFSEIVMLCGYMASLSVILAACRRAERRAHAKWEPSIQQHVSNRKNYPVQELTSRQEWRDGERLLFWWRREVWESQVCTIRPVAETTHTSGAAASMAKVTAIRQRWVSVAVRNQGGGSG
jgi:hypothetical protein